MSLPERAERVQKHSQKMSAFDHENSLGGNDW